VSSEPLSSTSSATEAYAKLLSLASHEFRTPASVVGGYLRMLQRDTESALSDRQRKMIDEAEKSCTRIVALLAEMSELARLDAGTAAWCASNFDLFRALGDVAPTVLESKDRGVELDIRGAEDGATISADPDRIKDAFAALFRAVLREQPSSCKVAVERRLVKPSVNGVGNGAGDTAQIAIAHEEEVSRVWTTMPAPFNEHRGGLGLTLPIARRVIERAGGSVASVFVVPPAGPSGSPAGAFLISFALEQQR
jgi:signal transduction histidine kinase